MCVYYIYMYAYTHTHTCIYIDVKAQESLALKKCSKNVHIDVRGE